MQINYGVWDLSVKELAVVGVYSACGGLGIGYLFYDNFLVGIPIMLGLLLTKSQYTKHLIEKRRAKLLLQFRDLLYSISSSVSVGRNMMQALGESITFWENTYTERDYIMIELNGMLRREKEGNDCDVAILEDFAQRSGLDDIEDFVGVYEICRDTGADLVKAIGQANRVIGDKIKLEKELHTLMAQKQFEGRIITLAPFVALLFLKVFSPQFLAPLTQSSSGYMIATFALLCIVCACILIERIHRIEV